MNTQNRIYVTLSPRIRKALELCANFDGSNSASYAATLLSMSTVQEIEKSPALSERWLDMEREALLKGGWDISPVVQPEQRQTRKAVPGWYLAGSHPALYEYGVEEIADGKNCGFLKSKEAGGTEGFGTLMQNFNPDDYRGKRLRYSAMVKAEEVEDWAGLWMRTDGASKQLLAFDNMQNRPIKGTSDWQQYEVVLDIALESTNIAFGILLHGSGQIWISDIEIAFVDSDIPSTDTLKAPRALSNKPLNLNFKG